LDGTRTKGANDQKVKRVKTDVEERTEGRVLRD